jgi:hypothetical protein
MPEKSTLNSKLQSVLLSVISAGIIGCFSFLWNLNATVAKISVDNNGHQRSIDNLQSTINNQRLEAIDDRKELATVKETVIRLEAQLKLLEGGKP